MVIQLIDGRKKKSCCLFDDDDDGDDDDNDNDDYDYDKISSLIDFDSKIKTFSNQLIHISRGEYDLMSLMIDDFLDSKTRWLLCV